jgi:predicted ATPase/class 3 adenylate cyclase
VGAPSGTVTFLFTDIEGSTQLWESAPDAMRAALARHDTIVRGGIEARGGYVFATGGDGFAAAFARAADGLATAIEVQAALSAETWPTGAELRVRMGLHTGEVEERGGDYFGSAVNRAARIMAAGHGGQVLVSATAAGLAGAAALTDLGEHAFSGLDKPERVHQLGEGAFPPLRSLGAVPSNLPAERSVFVGRDREIGVVAGLVRSARAVTLTGVGGVGKTRLAVQTAAGLAGEFPGGVWLVELAPLIDGALVATTVASAIGVVASPGAELGSADAVCRYLAPRRALVVLDNCEHVIDDAAALVDRLLLAAPRVRVLATSREPLNVAGESVWRVPSLTVEVDGAVGDAVALFAQRAAQARPGFTLDDRETSHAVIAVCRRLDGIPLAIELAAARTRAMSVEQIASHLDDRFRLLTRGARTAVPRQQTLQGAIDWSYELLGPPERELFDLLGVFAGGFDLAAVAAVAGTDELEALDLMDSMVGKSMVETDPGYDRYQLLETLRQYAWDRLLTTGRLGAARDAHAEHFSVLAAEQAKLMSVSGRQVGALDRLEADYDNLRAALAHLIAERRADDAVRLVRRLSGLFNIRHSREGFGWFQQVVAIAGELPANARARLLADTAWAAMNAGDLQAQARYATEAIGLGGDDAPANAYYILGMCQTYAGNYADAAEHLRRAITIAAASNDLTTQATAAGMLVQSLAWIGDEQAARQLIPSAIELAERLGNPTITAAVYFTAAEGLAVFGSARDVIAMLDKALAHADACGPSVGSAAWVLYSLQLDDPVDAAGALRGAVPLAKDQLAGYRQLLPLVAAAKIAAQTGKSELAARLLGTYIHYRDEGVHHVGYMTEGRWWEQLLDQLTERLGASVVDDELRDGAQLTPTQALQLAAELVDATA